MNNYLNSSYFTQWKKNRLILYYKYSFLSNLLHLILISVGFKKSINFLLYFSSESRKKYALFNQDAAILLKRNVNPIFKKIRKPKYLWSNCLSSSILLWLILKNQGLETQLIIGTNKNLDGFKAHAWVEYNKFPLNENSKIRNKYRIFEYDFSNNNIL